MLKAERVQDGTVVVWTIDRPDTKNALDHATLAALTTAARECASDSSLRAAILTGAGNVFVSGGDLNELRHRDSPQDAAELTDAGWALTTALANVPFPVIAALPGPAVGGGAELAVACDLRIADERARLSFPQTRMGVTTAWGTVPRLMALVGSSAAARLLYTAASVDALEAKRLGLVEDVTKDGECVQAALGWTSEISRGSPKAIAQMKALVRESVRAAHDVRSLERQLFIETWSGPDHRDAVEAWFERRPTRWQTR